MSIAVVITDRDTQILCHHLQDALPGVLIQNWPDIKDPESVKLAVLWQHRPGICQTMPRLQQVLSMGAGMDHIDADQTIPSTVNKGRIVTPALQQRMAQYVLSYVLADWRRHAAYQAQQQSQTWRVLDTGRRPVVGFLGLGALGGFVADRCRDLGMATLAWTAGSQHPLHRCLHGTEGLAAVCAQSDYLVNLLPLNADTIGLLNRHFFAQCQPHATLIQVGRGGHLHEADLIQALDQGRLKRAVLDVFADEPLPAEHPFWDHAKITVTPHSSARSDVKQTAEAIVAAYAALT